MSALLANPSKHSLRSPMTLIPHPPQSQEPPAHRMFSMLTHGVLWLILMVPLVALVIAGASFLPAIMLVLVIFLPAALPVLVLASTLLAGNPTGPRVRAPE